MPINHVPETLNNKNISGLHNTLTDIPAYTLRGRRILTDHETFYFRDGGDGTGFGAIQGTTAFGSLQDVEDYVLENIFTNGFTVIYAWDETSSAPDTFTGDPVLSITAPLVGNGKRILQGSSGGEDDLRIVSDVSGVAISVSGLAGEVEFTGKWWISAESGTGIKNQNKGRITNNGIITFGGDAFSTCIGNQHEGTAFINGPDGELKFEADASIFIFNDSGTFHDNGQIEFVNTPTCDALWDGNFFSQGYLCNANAMIGTFTGDRMRLRDRAVLRLQAPANHVIPGSARGTAQPGSVFSDQGATVNVMRGSKTFSASTTAAVDFSDEGLPDQYSTDYLVTVGGGVETRTYVVKPADRLTTGFTITASASNSDTVWWRLEWL